MSEEIKMTDEELGIAPMKVVPTEHAGTIDDPIPQSLIFVKTDKNTGKKKVYSLGGGVGGGGVSSDVEVNPATDQIIGVVKLTDDHTVDAPAAVGSVAMTPNGVKTAIEAAKTEITDGITDSVNSAIDDALQDGGKLDTAIDSAVDESIKDSIADGSLSGPIGDAVDQVVQDKIESGEIGGSTSPDAVYVVRPIITTPTDEATNVSTLATITGTTYKCVFTNELRANRQFQLADNAQFSPLIKDISVNADSYSFTEQLPANKKIYVRIRDISTSGYTSLWSEKISFTTAEGQTVTTPTITLKGYNDSDTDILSGLTITGSAFAVNEGSDTHRATSWSITKKTSTRSNAVWESLEDTTNKTTITVPDGTLEPSTDYVLTVVYHGTVAFDSAPAVVEFTTSDDFGTVAAPTLSVEGAPNDVYETPILTGGAFSNTRDPDTHDMTDWEILDATGTTPVWQSLNDATNKTTLEVPEGSLKVSTAYKARVRYHGTKYGWSAYTTVDFSTVAIFNWINTPTITVQGAPSDVKETPLLTGTAFGGKEVTHKSSDWKVLKASDNSEVWSSIGDTTNLTTIKVPKGKLEVSTAYIFQVRYNANEGVSSDWAEVTATCADMFIRYNYIGIPGTSTFGVGLANETDYKAVDLEPTENCEDETNFQYGLYGKNVDQIGTAVDVICMKWIPKFYIAMLQKEQGTVNLSDTELDALLPYVEVTKKQMKEAQRRSPHNAMVVAPLDAFTDSSEAASHGFYPMRAFTDGGKEYDGFFIANTYTSSWTIISGAAGVQKKTDYLIVGHPTNSLVSSIGTTVDLLRSNRVIPYYGGTIFSKPIAANCKGNFISRLQGTKYQCSSIFAEAVLSVLSLIQGQYATNTSECAWYDSSLVTNYPKGINNYTTDVDDASVVSDRVDGNTGSVFVKQGYEKTTHNGSITGITNVNGWLWQPTIGIWGGGSKLLKKSSSIYDITYDNVDNSSSSFWEEHNTSTVSAQWGGNKSSFPALNDNNAELFGIYPFGGNTNRNSSEFGKDALGRYSGYSFVDIGGYYNTGDSAGVFYRSGYYWTSSNDSYGTRAMAYPKV